MLFLMSQVRYMHDSSFEEEAHLKYRTAHPEPA